MTAPPQFGYGPTPPPRRSPTWLWVLLAVVVLVVVVGIGAAVVVANKDSTGAAAPTNSPSITLQIPTPAPTLPRTTAAAPGTARTVLYEVTSSTGTVAQLHYIDDGGPHTESKVPSPWSKEVQTRQKDALLTLTAQSGRDAEMTCRITVDGTVKAENTVQAPQSNAICSVS